MQASENYFENSLKINSLKQDFNNFEELGIKEQEYTIS